MIGGDHTTPPARCKNRSCRRWIFVDLGVSASWEAPYHLRFGIFEIFDVFAARLRRARTIPIDTFWYNGGKTSFLDKSRKL